MYKVFYYKKRTFDESNNRNGGSKVKIRLPKRSSWLLTRLFWKRNLLSALAASGLLRPVLVVAVAAVFSAGLLLQLQSPNANVNMQSVRFIVVF